MCSISLKLYALIYMLNQNVGAAVVEDVPMVPSTVEDEVNMKDNVDPVDENQISERWM